MCQARYLAPRYRLRLVSISCDPNFTFSIDGHSFTVIEADGVNHHPITVDNLQIFAGEFIVLVTVSFTDLCSR
jgi:FtsP/CotA-like multicopper oxidase with cupredoxin domain